MPNLPGLEAIFASPKIPSRQLHKKSNRFHDSFITFNYYYCFCSVLNKKVMLLSAIRENPGELLKKVIPLSLTVAIPGQGHKLM